MRNAIDKLTGNRNMQIPDVYKWEVENLKKLFLWDDTDGYYKIDEDRNRQTQCVLWLGDFLYRAPNCIHKIDQSLEEDYWRKFFSQIPICNQRLAFVMYMISTIY